MKTARLQAAFARKREVDNLRIERTQETNRYFDHWGKVTSRFQTWTTPEYYENAEIKLKESKEKLKKDEILNERRDKLQKLLDCENQQYENELQSIILRKHSPSVDSGRRRSKYDSIDTNILEKIKENHTDEMKRLELEAKLYKKWRNPNNGVTLSTTPLAIVGNQNNQSTTNDNEYLRNNSLFESKSDNEVMAKLNWLDKQIENQMRREEDEKEFQQRTLKLQQEATKREEIQRERQLIRESEIKELRTMQENNVAALKQRELETIQLQEDEQHYRHILETIETELNSLKLNYENFLKIFETNLPHNVKRIKILFRQLSDEFNERFQKDIDLLKRIKLLYSYAYNNDNNNIVINDGGGYTSVSPSDHIRLQTIEQLIENFEQQFNTENLNPSDICNMYESEAKNNFKKWQDYWYNQENLRKIKLIELLERDQIYYDGKLNDNLKQQKLIIEIRETHLSAMENSNEKLKMLINSSNNYNNDNSNNSNNHNNNHNNTKESKYYNYNQNNINAYDNSEYIKNKNNNNSTTLKDVICWNNNETTSPSPPPPPPATRTTIEPRLSRRSDGGACAAATANRNASRSSSRISHIHDLNSYREDSANSYQNTKSRIFGWLDDDNPENKSQENYLSHSNNNNNIHSFHKKRNIPNRRTTEGITTTSNANNNAIIPINNTIREDLISDLRNSRSKIINEQNNNNNNIIDSKSTKPIDVNPSSRKVTIDVPQSNNVIYSDIEQIHKNMNSNLNISGLHNNNQDKSSNDTQQMNNSSGLGQQIHKNMNSNLNISGLHNNNQDKSSNDTQQINNSSSGLGPKFGRKKFAWT